MLRTIMDGELWAVPTLREGTLGAPTPGVSGPLGQWRLRYRPLLRGLIDLGSVVECFTSRKAAVARIRELAKPRND